jgi:hypothetical protein
MSDSSPPSMWFILRREITRWSRLLNVVGLLLDLGGVLILFRWGMPFRVPANHALLLEGGMPLDPQEVSLDRIYAIYGYIGLWLLIIGTLLQILAALMPPTKSPVVKLSPD